MDDKYIPIACGFYDELESLAVKNKEVNFKYIENKQECEINDFIKDLKTKNKEEFVILKSGKEIRLDKLISINGKEPPKTC